MRFGLPGRPTVFQLGKNGSGRPRTSVDHGVRSTRDMIGTPSLTERNCYMDSGLFVGSLNVNGGYRARKEELLDQARDYNVDILALSDVRTKGQSEERVGGYKVFLSGVQSGRAQWGVGIAIKEELVRFVLDVRCINERLMWVSIKLEGGIYRVVSAYSPCDSSSRDNLDKFYEQLNDVFARKGTERLMLLGDLNARIGNSKSNSGYDKVVGKFGEDTLNSNGRRLLDFCDFNGLAISNSFFKHKWIHRYTYVNDSLGHKSVLDYVIVEQDFKKDIIDTRVFRGFSFGSDHFFVGSRLSVSKLCQNKRKKTVSRKFRVGKFKDEAVRALFEAKFGEKIKTLPVDCEDIEVEWENFKVFVLSAAEECLGSISSGGGNKKTGWWNADIKAAVLEKRKRFLVWLKDKTDEKSEAYNVAKQRVKALVKAAKDVAWRKFGEELEEAGQGRGKKFWSKVKDIRRGGEKEGCGSILDKDGQLVTDKVDVLKTWRGYFQDLHASVNQVVRPVEKSVESEEGIEISLDEVARKVSKLKAGKSAGVDEIRTEFLKNSGLAGIQWLHRILNLAMKSLVVPADWSYAVIAPIFKKGNRKICSNYRGISLLSVVGKVYTSILVDRVRAIVEDVLDECQGGFRPLRGCQDQIFCLRQAVEKLCEKNKDLYICFIDLEKAFDRVPREKLFGILSEYGIRGSLLKAIKSIYLGSKAAVRIDGELSDSFDVDEGVRQGCCLSPLLFIIFMDKIIKHANLEGNVRIGEVIMKILAYADDLVVMADDAKELQSNVDCLNAACEEFGMKISVGKTKVMHIGKSRKKIDCKLNGEELEQVSEFKYLGAKFSEDGKLVKEFEERRKMGNAIASQLRSHVFNKKELSSGTKLAIHRAIYRPTILYGSESWVDSGYLVHDLEVSDMRVLRSIANVTRREQWDNRIRNDDIRENLGVSSVEEAARVSRLRWFGHVQRMGDIRLPKRILAAEVPGALSRGRPRRRFIDSVKSDLEVRGLQLGDQTMCLTGDRRAWKRVVQP